MTFSSCITWLIIIANSIWCMRSHNMGLSSVRQGKRKRGVVVSSLSFRMKDESDMRMLEPPLWVVHYLQKSTPPLDGKEKPLQCYFELLGYLDHRPKTPVGKIIGPATLRHREVFRELAGHVDCYYRNTFIQQSLEGRSIPLVYYCPVHSYAVCNAVSVLSHRSKYVPFVLITQRNKQELSTSFTATLHHNVTRDPYDSSVFSTHSSWNDDKGVDVTIFNRPSAPTLSHEVSQNHVGITDTFLSWFRRFRQIVNLRRQLSPRTPSTHAEVAVCLVLPYNSAQLVQKALLVEHVRWYHEVLGFKVMIYDRGGAHHNALEANGLFLENGALSDDYHNYTMFDVLKINVRSLKKILDTDYDKILTLTHCRMEARALYNIQSVLVVDSDEFLYCADHRSSSTRSSQPHPLALGNYQRQAIQSLLRSARDNKIDQLSFTRFSPMFDVTHYGGARHACMLNAVRSKARTLFSCFAPISQRRGNYLPKSLMLNYVCPRSNTHESCIAKPLPDECTCVTALPEQCFVVHLRLNPLIPQKENAQNDVALQQGFRLELDRILKALPRPAIVKRSPNATLKLRPAIKNPAESIRGGHEILG